MSRWRSTSSPLSGLFEQSLQKPSKSSTSNNNVGSSSLLIDHSYHASQPPSSYNEPLLPPELWLQVLELLERDDLLTLTRVTSQLRNMALPFLWQTVTWHLQRMTVMPMPFVWVHTAPNNLNERHSTISFDRAYTDTYCHGGLVA